MAKEAKIGRAVSRGQGAGQAQTLSQPKRSEEGLGGETQPKFRLERLRRGSSLQSLQQALPGTRERPAKLRTATRRQGEQTFRIGLEQTAAAHHQRVTFYLFRQEKRSAFSRRRVFD